MDIVDFHTHLFSRAFFEALAQLSPLPGDVPTKLAALVARTKIELPGPSVRDHTQRWLGEMDKYRLRHMCSFASVPEEIGAVCEAANSSGGRISAFALVNPTVEGVAARVDELLAQKRIRGVLVFPAMHHFEIGAAESRPLLEALSRHDAIVYVHCGLLVVKIRDLLGLPRIQDLRYANPLAVVPAASAFPNVRFVIPHFGAGFFRETLLAGAQCSNVHVDTSSSNSWMATAPYRTSLREVFERALGVFGPERILFGTDSNTFPAGWRNDRWDEQHAALTEAGASTRVQEQIFAGNALRLLGLA